MSLPAMLNYYDVRGRTWERQAFIKARPVAGDLALGNQFLAQLTPWIYRRYLSRADIGGIKALKRRIEQDGRTARTRSATSKSATAAFATSSLSSSSCNFSMAATCRNFAPATPWRP